MPCGDTILPFVNFTVEELASLTSLEGWTNLRVRIVARISVYDPLVNTGILSSVGESGGPYELFCDFRLYKQLPPLEETLFIFGEACLDLRKRAFVLVVVKVFFINFCCFLLQFMLHI